MKTNTEVSRLIRLVLVLFLLSGAAFSTTSVLAQDTDPDDRFVREGDLFVNPEVLDRIDRDYIEFDAEEQGQDECGQYWVVLPGEYLSLVVINCDVPMNMLLEANSHIDDPTVIISRQVINIPETPNFDDEIVDPDTGLPYVTPPDEDGNGETGIPDTGAPFFTDITDLDAADQGINECGPELVIESGWTLHTIVVNCDAPYSELVRANAGTDFDTLQVGDRIRMPSGSFAEIYDPYTGRPYTYPATAGTDLGLPDTGNGGGGGGQIPDTGGDISRDELKFGTRGRLFIPDRSQTRLRELADDRDYREFDDEEQGRSECGLVYVLLPGESLSSVVVNCDIPRPELLNSNPWIDDASLVYPGEAILIPQGNYEEISDPFTDQPYTGEVLSTDL